jgi:exopolysaccharide biosynthesis polyprenyl glycosylphosphotransferase
MMTFITDLSANKPLDLRAPSLTQLRKRIGAFWLRIIALVSLDLMALFLAYELADILGGGLHANWNIQQDPTKLLPIMATQIGLIAVQGLYKSGASRRDYLSLTKVVTFYSVLLLLFDFLYQPGYLLSPFAFILSWLLCVAFVCSGRFCTDTVIMHLRKQGAITCPTFLISRPEDKAKAVKLLDKEGCYNLVGWANVQTATSQANLDTTLSEISRLGIAEVFVCSWESIENPMFLYWQLRNAGIIIHVLPIELQAIEQKLEPNMLGGIPVLNFVPPIITGSDFWIKRCFDFCCAAAAIILASPLYLCIALLIKLDSPGPVFYKQTRIGLHGQPFKVWKFRTMVMNADKLQKELEARNEMQDGVLFKMKDDPRITTLGKFLRRYSLDEIPQLFNVLFGEMSLVGPRPLPTRDVEKFSKHHFIRHEILPGITGLWQVSGRSDIIDFEKVIRLDMTYMENWSLSLDLQILLQTVRVILEKKGAY